jgi:thioester reductase-like protein
MKPHATSPMSPGSAGIGENVLLTGGTGLLGTQIVKRLLETCPQTRLVLLVRSSPRETAHERIERVLAGTLGETEASKVRERVEVVEGDIVHDGLALNAQCAAALRERIDHVIHCAASIRFDLPLEIARRDNTEGTRHVLDVARRLPRLRRLDYVGTAYVAGRRTGLILEDELDVGQRFWNSYERTKMEAEKLVRAFAVDHPATIYRPSVIVGDSRTGDTTAFQGLSQLLAIYMRRLTFAIPADPDTHVDLVPIDWVTSTLFALMGTTKSIGRCFHVAAGPDNTCTIGELVRMVAEFTNIRPPPYVSFDTYHRFVKPVFRTVLWGKKRAAMLRGEHFLPYLSSNFAFDTTNARACLEGPATGAPHPRTYFRRLMAFQARTLRGGVAGEDESSAADPAPARTGATP